MNTASRQNVDAAEIARFDAVAARWWDPAGEFRGLHQLNPLRVDYIERLAGLEGKAVIDVGCGGGILTEAMAERGAMVIGIDAADGPLTVAKLHCKESGLRIKYHKATAEQTAETKAQQFDVVTCMELLEHVPDPLSVVDACSRLVKPGGDVFFSTINRNLKSFLLAIVGGEYILRLLAKGTHQYEKFIRPSELGEWTRATHLQLEDITGVHYNPLTKSFALGGNVDVNYLMYCRRPGTDG